MKAAIACMPPEVAPSVVALSTFSAHEFQFTRVQALMGPQVSQLVKCLLTETTLVGFLPGVDFFVGLESRVVPKTLPTIRAHEWLLPCVDPFMVFKM